jgi:hypothetical protein
LGQGQFERRMKMIEVKVERFEDLSELEKDSTSNNGCGKEYAGYIRILQGGETICLESDAMEPEDAIFCRDLEWVPEMLKKCYEIGKSESK